MTSIDRRAAAFVACALVAWPASARSQSRDDDVRRRQLILQAGELRDRGDHEGALARLRQAAARRMSPSLRLFTAQEEQALGQAVEALRDARLCAADFDADPSLSHRGEFLASCRGLVDGLSQRVGRLIVRVPDATIAGVVVTVRGEPMPAEALGAPRDVLPGRVLVEASAPGRERFSREVTLAAGGSVTVRVELPRADPSSREANARPDWRGASRRGGDASQRGVGAGPWVLLATSGASFVLSGVFYALQGSATDARDALCRGASGDCAVRDASAAREANARQDDASAYNTLANVALGLGAAAAVGGVVWWIVGAGGSTSARSSATLLLVPSIDGAFVGVRGAF